MKNPTPSYVGLSLLGVCAGLLAMLAGFYFTPPADRFTVLARLTNIARVYYRPERDLQSYVTGCLVGAVIPALLLCRESKSRSSVEGDQCGRPVESKVGRHDLIGCPRGPLLRVHLAVWGGRRRLDCGGLEGTIGVKSPHISGPGVSTARPGIGRAVFGLGPACGSLAAPFPHRTGADRGKRPAPVYTRWRDRSMRPGKHPRATSSWLRETVWFATVSLSIAALLAVPDVSRLSGAIFMKGEHHHWDGYHHWGLLCRRSRPPGPRAVPWGRKLTLSTDPPFRSFLRNWTLWSRSATTIS